MISKDFKRRRDYLLRKIEDNSIVILFSGLEKFRNNDVNYKFRQSSNFFYLTGINNPSMMLIITKTSTRHSTTLVCDRPNDIDKIWHGQLPSKSSYKNQFEIQNVLYFDELKSLELMTQRTFILNSLMKTGSTNLLVISIFHNLNRDI